MTCYRKCYWNYDGICCPESEEAMDNAIMNDEHCPTYLRKDFEEVFHEVHEEIIELLRFRNFDELNSIKEFIVKQRENDINK